MKPLKEVAQAYVALAEAERQIQQKMYREAADNCLKAMEISRTIPAEEAFDHSGFDAFCHARLSEALCMLGIFGDSLASAEKALFYFNRRGELNQEDGKFWIAAVFSRGVSLQETGMASEGTKALGTAREMIAERKGELPGRETMLADIERRLAGSDNQAKPAGKQGYRAWWEFWS
ncbi:MAG: DUF3856 domain-containing protein [Chlorobiaceae bacterium]|jgi:hypothetical protein|nr:DUF3856 domain-containing protein [Chlorobiaceae bacterium]